MYPKAGQALKGRFEKDMVIDAGLGLFKCFVGQLTLPNSCSYDECYEIARANPLQPTISATGTQSGTA